MVERIYENKLGVAKGTSIEEVVEANFAGEAATLGLYLAVARQAEREGYPEIAEVLKSVAFEEAWHAARYAELNGKISASTLENLEKRSKGEQDSNKSKHKAAMMAKEAGIDEAHDFFEESARDEARHARALEGLLKRYFGR
jgi:rubrerythrin